MSELRISVQAAPPYSIHAVVIDEQELTRAIKKYMTFARDQAVDHDVAAIAAVMRIRGQHRTRFPEDSRALFVTTNQLLTRIARAFFRETTVPATFHRASLTLLY